MSSIRVSYISSLLPLLARLLLETESALVLRAFVDIYWMGSPSFRDSYPFQSSMVWVYSFLLLVTPTASVQTVCRRSIGSLGGVNTFGLVLPPS